MPAVHKVTKVMEWLAAHGCLMCDGTIVMDGGDRLRCQKCRSIYPHGSFVIEVQFPDDQARSLMDEWLRYWSKRAAVDIDGVRKELKSYRAHEKENGSLRTSCHNLKRRNQTLLKTIGRLREKIEHRRGPKGVRAVPGNGYYYAAKPTPDDREYKIDPSIKRDVDEVVCLIETVSLAETERETI